MSANRRRKWNAELFLVFRIYYARRWSSRITVNGVKGRGEGGAGVSRRLMRKGRGGGGVRLVTRQGLIIYQLLTGAAPPTPPLQYGEEGRVGEKDRA